MSASCDRLESLLFGDGESTRDLPLELSEHVASCSQCREQSRAHAVLREVFAEPPPAFGPEFDLRMRERLERHVAENPPAPFAEAAAPPAIASPAASPTVSPTASETVPVTPATLPWRAVKRPGRLPLSGVWVLGAYTTVATVAASVLLARIDWQTISPQALEGPTGVAFALTLGLIAVLSPLVLLDRVGIVRPPG